MYAIAIKNSAYKEYQKIKKSNIQMANKIYDFLAGVLESAENPTALPNGKKLKGYDDNRYRWKIGDYRIIGIVENGEVKIIEIIKIAHRQAAYKD